MIDTSDEAVEADLRLAESSTSDRVSRIALKRAELRVALRASQPLSAIEYQTEAVGAPPDPEAGRPGVTDVQVALWPGGASYVVPDAAEYTDRHEVASRIINTPDAASWIILKTAPRGDWLALAQQIINAAPSAEDPAEHSQYADADNEDADIWEQARQDREA